MDRSFEISFPKLTDGENRFEFALNQKFFERFECKKIGAAEIQIITFFEKVGSNFRSTINWNGKVKTECDRCTENIFVPVSGETEVLLKFSAESITQEDDDVVYILPHITEFDMAPLFYDFVLTSLPMRISCDIEEAEKLCDEEALKTLNQMNVETEHEPEHDERWDILKKLKPED